MKTNLIAFITFVLIFLPIIGWGQDVLMLKTGVMVPFVKLYQYEGVIELKIPYSKEKISFYPDEVFGYYDILSGQSYYLLLNPEPNDYEFDYLFLKRTMVGAINMYIDNARDYKMYLNKGDETYLVYRTLESSKYSDDRIDKFKELIIDDNLSVKYVESRDFKYKPREIELVVSQYNSRNFEYRSTTADQLTKQIFLYRTKFQKTKGVVRVWLFGKPHKLFIEDFIQLEVPVKYPSKLKITDGTVSTEKIVSASLAEQYFEVLYDSNTNSYVLEEKSGDELHFEFNRIKEKIEKEANR